MISDERIRAIEQAARLYGPANCWTGTSGALAAMIIELLNERKLMNRQARLEGSKEWTDYGKVSFFVAIKTEAIKASRRNSLPECVWIIECRCESDPDVIDTFSVQTRIDAEVLNPRKSDV
jgi:hypothetical protein